jgi:general secretion pathway protein K
MRARGFALLIVLWSLALLALLGSQMLATSRQDAQRARNLLDAAKLEAAADGAIQQAIYRLLDRTNRHWNPDGTTHAMQAGRAAVAVRMADEAEKINPNFASARLLQALLLQVGADGTTAATVAASIVEWRMASGVPAQAKAMLARYAAVGRSYAPSGAQFANVDELAQVIGMTPELLARLRPHLTVYTDDDSAPATRTDIVVAQALQAVGQVEGPSTNVGPVQLVSIFADARGPDHARYLANAIIRTNARPEGRRYDVLEYERLNTP